ncbi:hypothetical protein GOP47_0009544 [Adiantum capillus-veneris]|uniref:Secreted protein n=1 Tax=Adiantum capillus-veneris TaxID=13818 RepID=A0A9D4UXP4_ADICA|nr:hypothetical protein GOP47_0009544 [Adiantum capillus-veneris]
MVNINGLLRQILCLSSPLLGTVQLVRCSCSISPQECGSNQGCQCAAQGCQVYSARSSLVFGLQQQQRSSARASRSAIRNLSLTQDVACNDRSRKPVSTSSR